MGCPFCSGLRLCVRHHPPLVTFFLCLVTLGATFLYYGIYIRTYPVKDDDFTRDFDTVLQTLSASKICAQRNVTATSNPLNIGSASDHEDLANVSVLAGLTLSPWQLSFIHSDLQIHATASQLGMRGPGTASYLLITVTSSWWSAQCNDSDTRCSGKYCVTVTGPRSLLPQSWSPFQCSAANLSRPQLHLELYVVGVEMDAPSNCYSLQYREDPSLKAILSQEDCAVTSTHLLASVLVCLLLALLLFVVSGCWTLPIKDKRTPGEL
ncbi:insulin-like growth factor-binding protein 3 receptor isoform 1-T3 [Leptodactylus fuscus]|uniref:insulin-like growth factor-binding protein 3 receptor n=1 Tax=Leptodactylus fuscus TaxID=238119 RepID=UPI003F4F246C